MATCFIIICCSDSYWVQSAVELPVPELAEMLSRSVRGESASHWNAPRGFWHLCLGLEAEKPTSELSRKIVMVKLGALLHAGPTTSSAQLNFPGSFLLSCIGCRNGSWQPRASSRHLTWSGAIDPKGYRLRYFDAGTHLEQLAFNLSILGKTRLTQWRPPMSSRICLICLAFWCIVHYSSYYDYVLWIPLTINLIIVVAVCYSIYRGVVFLVVSSPAGPARPSPAALARASGLRLRPLPTWHVFAPWPQQCAANEKTPAIFDKLNSAFAALSPSSARTRSSKQR